MKKYFLWLATALAFLFSSCSQAEIEDREFPVILSVAGDTENFAQDWLNNLYAGNKKIDYNHLKVVVLEQEFLEQEDKMEEMLSLLKADKNVPLNAYVIAADSVEKLEEVGLDLEQPLGNYLEELLEHTEEVKKETFPTLGMLYQEEANQLETIFIPYVTVLTEKPEIVAYEAYRRGEALGVVDTDTAMLSFFVNNQMKEYELQLGESQFVKLSNTKNQITFAEVVHESNVLQKQVQVHVCCDAKILYQDVSQNEREVQRMLENEIRDYMEEKANNVLGEGLDVTNSKKMLGGSMRGWYGGYMDPDDAYEDDIEIIFDVDMKWID